MSSSRRHAKISLRDAPVLCLSAAVFAALFMMGLRLAAWAAQPPTLSELVVVPGEVIDHFVRKSGKGHAQLHLIVQAADGLHDCAQDATSLTLPLMNLQKGAEVVASVRYGSVAAPEDRLWELDISGDRLLKYESLVYRADQESQRMSSVARYFGIFAILILVVALVLRREFGSWRNSST
jgi:hypothetical protein